MNFRSDNLYAQLRIHLKTWKTASVFILFFVIIHFSASAQISGGFDEKFLSAIVNINSAGTGFIVTTSRSNDRATFKAYLVTNKHMIGNWSLVDPFIPKKDIIVNFYTLSGPNPIKPTVVKILDNNNSLLANVKPHPDPKIDVVVIDVSEYYMNDPSIDVSAFTTSFLLPLNQILNETTTGIGNRVLAVGYPAGITSKNTNKPIIKSGYIASSLSGDLEVYIDVKNRLGKITKEQVSGKYYLVDGLLIGGNSGGPVVNVREVKQRYAEGGVQFSEKPIPNLIFGIVSMGIGNTGISIIFSSDYIIELINSFP